MANNFDVNSQSKCVKAKKKKSEPFTEDENVMILRWLEERYRDLYGRAGSSHVAQDHSDAWEEFTEAVNGVHNGRYSRTAEDVVKRVDNMKTVGKKFDRSDIYWQKYQSDSTGIGPNVM